MDLTREPDLAALARIEHGLVPRPGFECYVQAMRPVEALYENGMLKPAKPLNLRPGERVAVIVVRHPEPARWDLARLASASNEDIELSTAGLDDWNASLGDEDRG